MTSEFHRIIQKSGKSTNICAFCVTGELYISPNGILSYDGFEIFDLAVLIYEVNY